jgi:glucan phosphoethanolaminetransferase (alkaline phosphatase superfamily)
MQISDRYTRILPWLHFLGAALVVVITALFSAVHSPLGQEISAGESPGFAWIRADIIPCLGFSLVYLILVGWLQIQQIRQAKPASRMMPLLICIQVVGIALVALLLFFQRTNPLPLILTVLLVSLLVQGARTLWRSGRFEYDRQSVVSQKYSANTGLFLVLLFVVGATISYIDPSWRRLSDQVFLDSDWEYNLRHLYPPVLSGAASVWFGIGMMIILIGFSRLQHRIGHRPGVNRVSDFLTFFSLVAAFSAFLLVTLYYAIPWQINNLNIKYTVWQLFVFFSVAGGILFSAVFYRIVPHSSVSQESSMIGLVALTIGATILFPITWLLTSGRSKRFSRMLLLISTFGICVFIGYAVLFGDLFNPWFTAFSYLKGAILKVVSVVAAGIVVLMIEQLHSFTSSGPFSFRRSVLTLAVFGILGLLPFYSLRKYPEVKAAVLQYNELTRVDTTFARELTNPLGLGRWIHLGQRPPQNDSPHPWPQPWRLEKTHPSLLPENFNLLVIVVDALRGDAFHSVGYQRNLTPFLDRWAREEAVSFRRAYSQGGGSFAAYPFLVAGRSRFDLYGPSLHQQNLYFKIAQAEGIQHYMLMKGFGPRDIYPPGLAVTELAIPRAVSDRRTATADEVFESARKAIHALPADERFLCFLTLMDVHNDLWKKDGGTDFGDMPRDLYDNNLSYLDRAFHRFISWLKESGNYNRTVILFTSDHGEQFWEHGASLHGHTVYEEEIRIPLILVSHAVQKRIEDVPVIAADMAPTIADLAGYSVDPPYDDPHMGISLLPLIMKNERAPYLKRDVIGRASFKRRYFLYRNWEWKLVYLAELDLLQLFNVVNDPSERSNLLEEEPGLTGELEHELLEYLKTVEGKTYHPLNSKK